MNSLKKYFPMVPTFKEKNELKEIVKYYLCNEDEALVIAEKSKEICRTKYRYKDSANIILNAP